MDSLRTSEVAVLLGASPQTIRRLIAAGAFPAVQLGEDEGWWRIERSALEAYANRKGITLNWSKIEKTTA